MALKDAPLFTSLPAHDIERAKRSYEEKLASDARVMDLARGRPALSAPAESQWLIYQTPSAGTAKHTLGGWVVPDIDAAMREPARQGRHVRGLRAGRPGPDETENGVAQGPEQRRRGGVVQGLRGQHPRPDRAAAGHGAARRLTRGAPGSSVGREPRRAAILAGVFAIVVGLALAGLRRRPNQQLGTAHRAGVGRRLRPEAGRRGPS